VDLAPGDAPEGLSPEDEAADGALEPARGVEGVEEAEQSLKRGGGVLRGGAVEEREEFVSFARTIRFFSLDLDSSEISGIKTLLPNAVVPIPERTLEAKEEEVEVEVEVDGDEEDAAADDDADAQVAVLASTLSSQCSLSTLWSLVDGFFLLL